MKISIGSDHRGVKLKSLIISSIKEVRANRGTVKIDWLDRGAHDEKRSDYPTFAKKVCEDILSFKAQAGILICGSGVGMAIAANRYKKIYAALCFSPQVAKVACEDDGINVLALASDFLSDNEALAIVQITIQSWIDEVFKGGRYQERLDMVDRIVG